MKRLSCVLLTVALIVSLVGCGEQKSKTLLEYDKILVTQTGRNTTVTDGETGKEYHFTKTRRKRPQNAVEAAERMIPRTAVETDRLTVQLVQNAIIVEVKDERAIIHHFYIVP